MYVFYYLLKLEVLKLHYQPQRSICLLGSIPAAQDLEVKSTQLTRKRIMRVAGVLCLPDLFPKNA